MTPARIRIAFNGGPRNGRFDDAPADFYGVGDVGGEYVRTGVFVPAPAETRGHGDAERLDWKPSPEQFLILCLDSGFGDLALWWRANRSGYTTHFDRAGRYSEAEAREIENADRPDIAVPLSLAREAAVRVVPREQPLVGFVNNRIAELRAARAQPSSSGAPER